MKKYNELSSEQQKKAVRYSMDQFFEALCKGHLRLEDEPQSRVEAAIKKAEDLHTPWFASEYIASDAVVMEYLEVLAESEAEELLYLEDEENAVRLILIDRVEL